MRRQRSVLEGEKKKKIIRKKKIKIMKISRKKTIKRTKGSKCDLSSWGRNDQKRQK